MSSSGSGGTEMTNPGVADHVLATGQPTPALFRSAMAAFPSGVTIVTTTDGDGRWRGFTASSFCSVSTDPQLVLVCLDQSAECYPVFAAARRWLVHVIGPGHAESARRFATRGADKFTGSDFRPDAHGLPQLHGAAVTIACVDYAKLPGGDHLILVGRVDRIHLGDDHPVVYYRRDFHQLRSAGAAV
jgi:flavin reductase ActVB